MNACGDSRLRGLRSRKPIGFRQWVVHHAMQSIYFAARIPEECVNKTAGDKRNGIMGYIR